MDLSAGLTKCMLLISVQELKEARSLAGQSFRGGQEFLGSQGPGARSQESGGSSELTGGCCHSAEQGPRVCHYGFQGARLSWIQVLQEWGSDGNLPRGWMMTALWEDIL